MFNFSYPCYPLIPPLSFLPSPSSLPPTLPSIPVILHIQLIVDKFVLCYKAYLCQIFLHTFIINAMPGCISFNSIKIHLKNAVKKMITCGFPAVHKTWPKTQLSTVNRSKRGTVHYLNNSLPLNDVAPLTSCSSFALH